MRWLLYLLPLLLLAACFTPRQAEAVSTLTTMLGEGTISQAQFDALVAALNPGTWVQDLIEIGGSILGGGGLGLVATNAVRNRARRKRGEPVAAKPA